MSFDAIGIVSENPDKSVQFYRLLGIEINACGNSGHYEGLSASGVRIMLDTIEVIRSINPEWKKSNGNAITLCFKQGSARLVDETYNRITQAGFRSVKAPWDAFWGQRYACVSDPDGNQIDLFALL